jgi:hypothetical protein
MIHTADIVATERDKYATIWEFPEYYNYSPGKENVERFMSVMKPPLANGILSLIDIGCGAGVAGLEFEKLGFDVSYLDLTDRGLDAKVDRSRFIQSSLWAPWGHRSWDYGFCCDVMEHIPTEMTMLCIDRVLSSCQVAWLQIALRPDNFGALIGQPLHLTVKPFTWWLERLAQLGNVVDARDLCGDGLYVVERWQ